MPITWADRPYDSLAFWPSARDPLAQRATAAVSEHLGEWQVHIPGEPYVLVSTREEAKQIVEATAILKGQI